MKKTVILYIVVLTTLLACNSTSSSENEIYTEEFIRAEINGEMVDITKPPSSTANFASLIQDEGRDRITISGRTISFPYVFNVGFSFFPESAAFDTTYTLQQQIYDMENAYSSIAELDWDVFISRYNPVQGERNVMQIRNYYNEDGEMIVEGRFEMIMAFDSSYVNSGSAVIDRQYGDTLRVTNGSFKAVVDDLRNKRP